MAAGMLPNPGTEIGPCPEPCAHIDCADTRATAAAVCSYCDQPIGYMTRFYRHGDELVHAACEEEACEVFADLDAQFTDPTR